MTITINSRTVEIFAGATAGDAVLAYSKHSYRLLMNGKLMLLDRFGNLTEPDGPVRHGQVFRLVRNIGA